MSLDVVITNHDEEQLRGLARSTSSTSSIPAHQDNSQHQRSHTSNTANGGRSKYEYVPYNKSMSSSQQTVHKKYGSQNSLTGQPTNKVTNPRSQYVGFTSQGIGVQRSSQQHSGISSSQSQNSFQYRGQRSQHGYGHSHQQQHLGHSIADRQARSSSVKNNVRQRTERYAEFSDTHHQFNNHTATQYNRFSSSSSESSPHDSPQHSSSVSPYSAQYNPQHAPTNRSPQYSPQHSYRSPYNSSPNPQHCSRSDYQQQDRQHYLQQHRSGSALHTSDQIHDDLHEMQFSKQSNTSHGSSPFNYTHRSSKHTYIKSKSSRPPQRVNSSESFSFASSIKCCVGVQPKKKASRRILVQQARQKQRERERMAGIEKENKNGASPNNWMSLASVKSHLPMAHSYHNSPNQSTVSCPYTSNFPPSSRNSTYNGYSNGYVSGAETSRSTLSTNHRNRYESDSEFSDSDFSRAAGSRGKSAGSVMMKLAKKFSKRNLPIPRDDEDSDSSWKMRTRSNSVSHLESTEG